MMVMTMTMGVHHLSDSQSVSPALTVDLTLCRVIRRKITDPCMVFLVNGCSFSTSVVGLVPVKTSQYSSW
jgi:hypothetical protein